MGPPALLETFGCGKLATMVHGSSVAEWNLAFPSWGRILPGHQFILFRCSSIDRSIVVIAQDYIFYAARLQKTHPGNLDVGLYVGHPCMVKSSCLFWVPDARRVLLPQNTNEACATGVTSFFGSLHWYAPFRNYPCMHMSVERKHNNLIPFLAEPVARTGEIFPWSQNIEWCHSLASWHLIRPNPFPKVTSTKMLEDTQKLERKGVRRCSQSQTHSPERLKQASSANRLKASSGQ